VSFDEVVTEGNDIVDGELRCGMGIHHCSLINRIFLLGNSCFDGEKLYIDIGHVHCGTLNRKRGLLNGLNAVLVNQTGYFYACLTGKIRDKTVVEYVTADPVRFVCNHSFHDVRCIFDGTGMTYISVDVILTVILPSGDLVYTAARIFVKGNIVLFDQFGILRLDEEAVVFGVMFA